MNNLLVYFKGSILVTLMGLLAAYTMGGLEIVFIVFVLAILEISLSFDNAVVNAFILKDMSPIWRRRFLTWGIAIAVFGMRIIFPLMIVSVVTGISPWSALDIAINSPDVYAQVITSSQISIMAFGGAFLMMVGLDFFLDADKRHWIPWIEKPLAMLTRCKFAAQILTVLVVVAVAYIALVGEAQSSFGSSALAGIITFSIVRQIGKVMEAKEKARVSQHLAKSGFSMFLYLEFIDASFSFDGVIGAFAISTNLFIIAIGLGIGAMFVRSLTIVLVEKEILAEYEYLEHGAFYAIIALALMMFIKTFHEVPEIITGTIGAGFIILAFIHSVIVNKRNANGA